MDTGFLITAYESNEDVPQPSGEARTAQARCTYIQSTGSAIGSERIESNHLAQPSRSNMPALLSRPGEGE